MDKTKTSFIVLIVILAVLALAAAYSMGWFSKADTKLNVLTKDSLSSDEQIKVKLLTKDKKLASKTVYFKFTDEKGNVKDYSVKTKEQGLAELDLKDLDSGNYTVNVTFEGDDKYNPASTSQKLEIKEPVVEEEPVYVEPTAASNQQTASSGDSDIAEYRDFVSWDYAPGVHVRETTYKNGDVKHEYDDGSSDYYDSSAHEWRYKDADGRQGSMYVG